MAVLLVFTWVLGVCSPNRVWPAFTKHLQPAGPVLSLLELLGSLVGRVLCVCLGVRSTFEGQGWFSPYTFMNQGTTQFIRF